MAGRGRGPRGAVSVEGRGAPTNGHQSIGYETFAPINFDRFNCPCTLEELNKNGSVLGAHQTQRPFICDLPQSAPFTAAHHRPCWTNLGDVGVRTLSTPFLCLPNDFHITQHKTGLESSGGDFPFLYHFWISHVIFFSLTNHCLLSLPSKKNNLGPCAPMAGTTRLYSVGCVIWAQSNPPIPTSFLQRAPLDSPRAWHWEHGRHSNNIYWS